MDFKDEGARPGARGGLTRREALAATTTASILIAAFAGAPVCALAAGRAADDGGTSSAADGDGEVAASRGASASASSSAGDAASSSDASTVERNRVHHFEDIPSDALMSVDELHDLVEQGALDDRSLYLIDIRSHRDFSNVQIEGARNIPAGRQIEIRINEIPTDKPVALIALKNSDRLAETWFTLMDHGYDESLVKVVQGGVDAWVDAGYPVLEDQFLGC